MLWPTCQGTGLGCLNTLVYPHVSSFEPYKNSPGEECKNSMESFSALILSNLVMVSVNFIQYSCNQNRGDGWGASKRSFFITRGGGVPGRVQT